MVGDEEEVEEAEEGEERVTEISVLEGTPNSVANTSVSMTRKVPINHKRQSRHGAVTALSLTVV